MTVGDIIALAKLQVEEYYDDATWIKYINAALDDLTPVAKMLCTKENITLTASGGKVELVLSSDPDLAKVHEVKNVYVSLDGKPYERLRMIPAGDLLSTGWKRLADRIVFQGLSSFTTAVARVDYYKKLSYVSGLSDVPELPEQYHNLLVLYACARSQQKEEELNDKNDFYTEYLAAKRKFALDRIWEMEPENRKLIRETRLLAQIGAGNV